MRGATAVAAVGGMSRSTMNQGDPDRPWFIVDLDIPPTAATAVARRIDGIYFHGRFLHASVMLPMGSAS